MTNKKRAFKQAIVLGCLTLDIAHDAEKNGGLDEKHIDTILNCVSSLFTDIGRALDMEDQVTKIYQQVREEMLAFNAIPNEYKDMLIDNKHGFEGPYNA